MGLSILTVWQLSVHLEYESEIKDHHVLRVMYESPILI